MFHIPNSFLSAQGCPNVTNVMLHVNDVLPQIIILGFPPQTSSLPINSIAL